MNNGPKVGGVNPGDSTSENTDNVNSFTSNRKMDPSIDVGTPNQYQTISPLVPTHHQKGPEPVDKGNMVNIIFLLWGIGVLLPWNAVLTCFDFLSAEMKGYQPSFIYPFAVNGLNAFSQIVVILYGHKISNRVKIQFAFYAACVIILALPLMAHFLPTAQIKFVSCFILLMCFGIINGALQGQVFGLGGLLPGKYMGSIMFGNGLSGISMNVLRVIFIATLPADSLYLQAQIFFVIAALILFICGYSYDILMRNPYFQYYQNKAREQDQRFQDLRVAEDMDNDEARQDYINHPDEEHRKMLIKRKQIDKIVHKSHTLGAFFKQLGQNFLAAWKVLMSLWLVFTVTFIIFPGAFFLSHFNFMGKLGDSEFMWYSQMMILGFNVFDTVGRKLGGVIKVSPTMTYVLSIARIAFIFTTIYIAKDEVEQTRFIENDAFKMMNMILFAFTNGFVSTLLSIYIPQLVKEDQREQAGIFVGLSICLGIMTGSIVAIPVGHVLKSAYWPSS